MRHVVVARHVRVPQRLVLLEMELTPEESMKRVRHPGGAVRAQ